MLNKMNGYVILALLAAQEMRQKLERGDSDSAGSTMRTMGIIVLVIAVVLLIGAAVMAAAGTVAGELEGNPFPW